MLCFCLRFHSSFVNCAGRVVHFFWTGLAWPSLALPVFLSLAQLDFCYQSSKSRVPDVTIGLWIGLIYETGQAAIYWCLTVSLAFWSVWKFSPLINLANPVSHPACAVLWFLVNYTYMCVHVDCRRVYVYVYTCLACICLYHGIHRLSFFRHPKSTCNV